MALLLCLDLYRFGLILMSGFGIWFTTQYVKIPITVATKIADNKYIIMPCKIVLLIINLPREHVEINRGYTEILSNLGR